MSSYLGDFVEDAVVEIFFTTHDGDGGAVAPSTPFEAADVRIYKGHSNEEKATANGVTMTSPFDSITGLHQLSIDTSVDTGDVDFWVAASDYTIVLSPDETVDGQTVVRVIGQFSIQNRYMRGTDSAALASIWTSTIAGRIDTTISSRSSHLAADVVTALGTGSTLTDCLTAIGFSTHAAADVAALVLATPANKLATDASGYITYANTAPPTTAEIKTAMEAAGSHLAEILTDTGTTLPASLTTIAGYVDCLPASWVTVPTANEVADAVLKRDIDQVEATAPEHSLCTVILAALESSVDGTTWTIKRTDGSTTHATKTLIVDADAAPITGVS